MLSRVGSIVQDVWAGLSNHYRNVGLDEFVIMPDHVHGILVLRIRRRWRTGPTRVGTVPEAIRSLKSFSTREANKNLVRPRPLWQRGYYERVIRNPWELDRFREYIRTNPRRRWAEITEAGLRGPTGGS